MASMKVSSLGAPPLPPTQVRLTKAATMSPKPRPTPPQPINSTGPTSVSGGIEYKMPERPSPSTQPPRMTVNRCMLCMMSETGAEPPRLSCILPSLGRMSRSCPVKYDQYTRAKASRLVRDHAGDYPTEYAAITAVSR
jgi:hypothetical protein